MSTLHLRSQIRENHLTCPICLTNFIKPKALPCLHTYCIICLRDYVISRGYESKGYFPCPECRAETTMPNNGVEGFPDNHLMLSLSDTVELATPVRPIPKPRKSLGQQQLQQEKDDNELPPPYSSVADANPHNITDQGQEDKSISSKLCVNDTDADWMVVPRQTPSAPEGHSTCQGEYTNLTEFSTTIAYTPSNINEMPGTVCPTSKSEQMTQDIHYSGGASSGLPIYPDLTNVAGANDNMHSSFNRDPPSCKRSRHDGGTTLNTHTPKEDPMRYGPARLAPLIYPSVPPNIEYNNVACSENLMLKFGKQGSSVRDFLKPVGLSVSREGNYIVSDSSGEQNRIFIFSSGGELTGAFKCGCKAKDVTITKNNEIFVAVQKNASAIRHFTMAGQLKGEYGKSFTYEVPCGIAQLKNGGVVVTGIQNHCVYVLTDQMKLATKFGRKGNGDGYFQHPGYAAVDSRNHIIVTDKINNSVQTFGTDGRFKQRFGSAGSGHGNLQAPLGVCVDADDNIIVADSDNCRVEVFTSKGRWLGSVVKNTHELGEKVKPINVAVTPTGKIAVLLRGPYFAEVRVYSWNHNILHRSNNKEGAVSTTSAIWHVSK